MAIKRKQITLNTLLNQKNSLTTFETLFHQGKLVAMGRSDGTAPDGTKIKAEDFLKRTVIPPASTPTGLAVRKRINDAIRFKVPIPASPYSFPIGLSTITGRAGSGKTSYVMRDVANSIDGENVYELRFGEPGYLHPYSLSSLILSMGLVIVNTAATTSESGGKPGILLVDSLMGMWFDPSVTSGFSTGRGGASLGVPACLAILDHIAAFYGLRLITVLHPVFADPELITSGVSGVSSFYMNRDDGSWIIRPYEPLADTDFSLSYKRDGSSGSDLMTSLIKGMGDED